MGIAGCLQNFGGQGYGYEYHSSAATRHGHLHGLRGCHCGTASDLVRLGHDLSLWKCASVAPIRMSSESSDWQIRARRGFPTVASPLPKHPLSILSIPAKCIRVVLVAGKRLATGSVLCHITTYGSWLWYILYYAILYYTILYYTTLHYTIILYYTIIYYTILY